MHHDYASKIDSLRAMFKAEVSVDDHYLHVGDRAYPIIDGVIILCEPGEYTELVQKKLGLKADVAESDSTYDRDIQYTFGQEWTEYDAVLGEHSKEFEEYFDLVDTAKLRESRVCDLGCGIGRWSYYLADKCRELVLVDFSDAIFVARENLKGHQNTIFFMCNIKKLPFARDFADFLFCLGVLHHLPSNCLDEVRSLQKYARQVLIYLYYACDNRPRYYSALLKGVTFFREGLAKIKSPRARSFICKMLTFGVYAPLIGLGHVFEIFGKGSLVPLYDGYKDKSVIRIEQDVYDRFFTGIEQRVSRKEILELKDVYSEVRVSDGLPYWHFLCVR